MAVKQLNKPQSVLSTPVFSQPVEIATAENRCIARALEREVKDEMPLLLTMSAFLTAPMFR